MIYYETGAVSSHARSLWRLETLRVVYVDLIDFDFLLNNHNLSIILSYQKSNFFSHT